MTGEAPEFVDFPTDTVITEVMSGNGTDGIIRLTFLTPPGGPHLRTVLRPQLTAELAGQCMLAVSNIPRLDAAFGLNVPRKRPIKGAAAIHFGQGYPPDLLQALGVLIVRVNLLERSLVRLLAAIADLSDPQAEALFFSTQNTNARLGMIRALGDASGLTDGTRELVGKALDKAKAVSDRRNDIVHGHWTLNNDNFEVETIRPQNAQKRSKQTVTQKSLEILAVDYRSAGTLAEACVHPVARERSIARNTSTTSSASPDGTS